MRRSPTVALIGLVGVALLMTAVTGCRQPDQLDMGRAERRIATSLNQAYGLPVAQVRCPDEVDVRSGATFACTVRISNRPLTVRVTQRNGDGDLRVEATSAVLVMAKVREELKETLGKQLKKTNLKAGCGSASLRIVAPGGTFECKVSDGTTSRAVTVRVRDGSGSLSFTLH